MGKMSREWFAERCNARNECRELTLASFLTVLLILTLI